MRGEMALVPMLGGEPGMLRMTRMMGDVPIMMVVV